MKLLCKAFCEIQLPIEVDKYLGQAHFCLFLPDSASNPKIFIKNSIQSKVLTVTMHAEFPATNVLLLQLVVETMVNAIIT